MSRTETGDTPVLLSPTPRTTLVVLAFSPGGLAEMSLIAIAIGADAAFVATHHVVRIFMIVAFAPLAFKLMGRRLMDRRVR